MELFEQRRLLSECVHDNAGDLLGDLLGSEQPWK
jgi:hypothetical protein